MSAPVHRTVVYRVDPAAVDRVETATVEDPLFTRLTEVATTPSLGST